MEPLISIVTPSFNQGQFLPDAIQSVLGQRYPRLEYVVMDGESRDASPHIIERFASQLHFWQSKPDGGQAAAINSGFGKCSGQILGWLNSDDFYLPGTLEHTSKLLDPTKPQLLAGNCLTIDPAKHRSSYSSVAEKLAAHNLEFWDYLIQPSTFWTRKAWELAGPLDEDLRYTFDWDWFIRARRKGVEFIPTERCLSVYRIHPEHKSAEPGDKRLQELALIYERYHGAELKRAFLRCAERKRAIHNFRSRLKKWRLATRETALLNLRFPGLLSGLTQDQLDGVLAMI